jgi:hypothetical protein
MPVKYQKKLHEERAYILTVDILEAIVNNLDIYDSDMGQKSFAFMEPPSIDSRIINQYALFSDIPHNIYNLADFFDSYTENTTKFIVK